MVNVIARLALWLPALALAVLLSSTLLIVDVVSGQEVVDGGAAMIDCSFVDDVILEDAADGVLTLRTAVNSAAGEVTVQLEYEGPPSWLGFSFSDTGMIGSTAVIGSAAASASGSGSGASASQAGVPAKYLLGDSAKFDPAGAIVALDASKQTLTNAAFQQNETHSVLTFTKPTEEEGELTVADGFNSIIYAVGTGTDLTDLGHRRRGSRFLKFQSCRSAGGGSNAGGDEEEEAGGAAAAPDDLLQDPDADAELDCGLYDTRALKEDGSITVRHVYHPVEETLTVELAYEGGGWLGFGFSEEGRMLGSLAVIGTPSDGTVAKYALNSKSDPNLITLLPPERQTLTDTSIEQNDTHTTLKFTKLLEEEDEISILPPPGANVFLYAAGIGNALSQSGHGRNRNAFPLELTPCRVEGASGGGGEAGNAQNPIDFLDAAASNTRGMWVAHGLIMAIAWGALVPLAVASSLLRYILGWAQGGFWFRVHFCVNLTAVTMCLIGFALAVAATSMDAEGDETAQHFAGVTHKTSGLFVFLLALLQAAGGILRPHLPHQNNHQDQKPDDTGAQPAAAAAAPPAAAKKDWEAGQQTDKTFRASETNSPMPDTDQVTEHIAAADEEEKSPVRRFWEFGHRVVGATLLGLAFYNCHSGIGLLVRRYGDDYDKTAAFWGIAGTLIGGTAVLYVAQMATTRKSN